MASWAEIERDEADFAARAQKRFDAYRHKIIATLRKDGSPRISGIEVAFQDGEVWLGMMPGSLKARDLMRDPRLALHSGTEDPNDDAMAGVVVDAKLSGRAVQVDDADALRKITGAEPGEGPQAHLFKVDIDEVVLISIGEPADHLSIETWKSDKGLARRKRY